MPTRKPAARLPHTRSAPPQPSPSHHLHALLHTIRCITQYEDALCELEHELNGPEPPSHDSIVELQDILARIPSHEYLADLEAVRSVVSAPRPTATPRAAKASRRAPLQKKSGKKKPIPKKSLPKKSIQNKPARKNTTSATQRPRRSPSK